MKRFLSIFILLVMVLLTACGGASDEPERIDFHKGSYVLLWKNEDGKVIREENYDHDEWDSCFEYEYNEIGKRAMMRKLDEDGEEIFHTCYYYEDGVKAKEEYYEKGILGSITENGNIKSWSQLVEVDDKEATFYYDGNDILKNVRIFTNGADGKLTSYYFFFDEEGYLTEIRERHSSIDREVTDPNEIDQALTLLYPFSE